MSLSEVKLIELPKITDFRGSISFAEGNNHIPFDIKRVYYLYESPPNAERGAHGHKKLEQVIIPISGSFDFILDDGHARQKYVLDKPWVGLYVPPMMWRDVNNFSVGSVCLVLASDTYKEEDYYRDYQEFLNAARK